MLQLIADGLVVGSIVALGAIGVTLTYSILRFANFAHGEFLTWGAYMASSVLAGFAGMVGPMQPIGPFSFGWPLIASLAVAATATAALALTLDRVLFQSASENEITVELRSSPVECELEIRSRDGASIVARLGSSKAIALADALKRACPNSPGGTAAGSAKKALTVPNATRRWAMMAVEPVE